jgi:hypothetical protein
MIQEFLSSFTEDLARPSRFDVKINIPLDLTHILDAKTLALRCENAVLPGRTLNTTDLKIYGPSEKIPYQTAYEDVTLTFIVTGHMLEKEIFSAWLTKINPHDNWNFEFKNNYVADITITQYDVSDNEIHTVQLVEAFPISMNQLDLDWSNDNAYHKLSVTFAYRYWYTAATAERNHAIGVARNAMPNLAGNVPNMQTTRNISNPISLQAALEIGSLAMNAGKALKSGNPYAVLGVIGAATSVIPSIGGTKTLSSLINSQGRSATDTAMDNAASDANQSKNTIQGLKKSTNNFNF